MENQKVTPKVIAIVWRHWKSSFRKNRTTLLLTLFFYSISMYLEHMFRPVQLKKVFDALTESGSPWDAFIVIIWATAIGWLCSRLADWCIVLGEAKLIKDLKDYVMHGLLTKSTQFFTNNSSGSLVAKSKRFATVSETVIDEFVFSISRCVMLIVYIVFYTWILIPELMPVFVTWVILFLIMTITMSKIRMKYDLESSKADSVTTGQVSDILLSVFTLRVFSAVPRVRNDFNSITADEESKRKKSWFMGNAQWGLQAIFVIILELYCLNTMFTGVQNGIYTIGTAVLVQSYIASLAMYMWNFGRSLIKMRTAFADAYEMALLLDDESSELDDSESYSFENNPKSLVIDNVTFNYQGGVQALKNFSFDFKQGRRYGLIGVTGSGKTTLTKLMLRMYEITSGSVFMNDVDVSKIGKNYLRAHVAYVQQDPQFPSWTIRKIISMGHADATDEEIIIAAKKASCDFIFDKLPLGLDTTVGERGVKLSGGERQRLAIAAAILKDCPIVIMDEPTSALDAKTERSIQEAIKENFRGKTLIVIAHRLSTVAVLDEIILLENGSVKISGPHDVLLETSNEYREMWELQTNPQLI